MNENCLIKKDSSNKLTKKIGLIVIVLFIMMLLLSGTVKADGIDVDTNNVQDLLDLSDDDWSKLTDEQLSEIERNMNANMNGLFSVGSDMYDKSNTISQKVMTERARRTESDEADSELLGYNADEIQDWLWHNDPSNLSQEVKDDWRQKIENSGNGDSWINAVINRLNGMSINSSVDVTGNEIYVLPENTSDQSSTGNGLQSVFDNASVFEASGNDNVYDESTLQDFSQSIYNILLSIGVAVAVIVGMVLGIKFMMVGVDSKADVKKQLVVYVAGCIIVFGAFGIWKLAVELFQNI